MINKLKRWLRGDADWKAEQELDQLAQQDAFLSDAMEGYRAIPEADHSKVVNTLKEKLRNTYAEKERKRSWIGIVASAAAIALAVSVFLWIQDDVKSPETIVDASPLNKQKTEIQPSIVPENKKETAEITGNTSKDEMVETEAPKPSTTFNVEERRTSPQLKVDPSNIEAGIIEEEDLAEAYADEAYEVEGQGSDNELDTAASEEAIASTTIAKEEAYPPANVDEVVVTAPPVRTIEKSSAVVTDAAVKDAAGESKKRQQSDEERAGYIQDTDIAKTKNPASDAFTLNGRVFEASSNEPVIGASIYIKDSGEGAATDLDGNFILRSGQELPWTIIVSYTGYTNQELLVTTLDSPFTIYMEEGGVALSEVVVTSADISRKKSRAEKNAIKTPKPRSGNKKMKRYLRKNLKYPEAAKQKGIEGSVTVRFFINSKGKPEQLSILNALDTDCDQEAIRLLKEGPKWEPKGVWATYTIEFNL